VLLRFYLVTFTQTINIILILSFLVSFHFSPTRQIYLHTLSAHTSTNQSRPNNIAQGRAFELSSRGKIRHSVECNETLKMQQSNSSMCSLKYLNRLLHKKLSTQLNYLLANDSILSTTYYCQYHFQFRGTASENTVDVPVQ
jgi:hypothetical protein